MKKNNKIILLSENEKLITSISKAYKDEIILINTNIYVLEKVRHNNNITIYPIQLKEYYHYDEKIILSNIIKKYLNVISTIIIDTKTPENAQTFKNTNTKTLIESVNNEITYTTQLLNFFSNLEKKIKLIILINKEKKISNNFFTIKNCINKFLIELMKNENNNNVNINCISTENINLDYKNYIYPFKNKKKLKNISTLAQACKFTIEKNIKNKIIIA